MTDKKSKDNKAPELRKRAEEARIENEERLRSIVEKSAAGYFFIDCDGHYKSVNTAWLRMHGYDSPEEVLGRHFSITQVDTSKANEVVKRLLDGEVSTSGEFTRLCKDGSIAWHTFSINSVMQRGKVVGIEGFLIDITKLKLAEEALRESESFMQAVLQSTADGILAVNCEGRLVCANERFMEMWKIPTESIAGKDDATLIQYVLDQLMEPQAFLRKVQEMYHSEGNSFDTLYFKDGRILERLSCPLMRGDKLNGRVWSFRDITERRRVEETLKESEYFFKESQRAAHIGSYKTDFIAGFWESSEVMDDIFGIDRDYNRSVQGWLDIVHPDDRDMMGKYLREEVIAKCNPFSKEYRIIRKNDGETRWVYGSGKLKMDSGGKLLSMIGTIQDISERKLAEDALWHAQTLILTLMENLPDCIYFKDTSCCFMRINPELAKLFCVSDPEKVTGKSDADFFSDEYAKKTLAEEQSIMCTGQPLLGIEEKSMWPDGRVRWMLTSKLPLRDSTGNIIGTCGISTDITERKKAEETLQESENNLRFALEGSNDGLWDVQMQNGKVYLSPRGCEILGYGAAGLPDVIKKWNQLVHPDDLPATNERLRLHFEGISPIFEVEQRILTGTGDWKWILTRGKVVTRDAKGRPLRVTGTHTDISVRKKAEAELKEKMDELQRFHDLTVGREINMIELKKEVNELLKKMGQKEKYRIVG